MHKNTMMNCCGTWLSLFLILTLLLVIFPLTVSAQDITDTTNSETGYKQILLDEADLLTDAEEQGLTEVMRPITAYGGVAFVSIDQNPYSSAKTYAEHFTDTYFAGSTGTVFLIDMDTRMIYIDTTGSMRSELTGAYADTITDNVYSYASRQEYYSCASQAFQQIYTILEGGRIAQPMKHISNILLAIVLAALINYGIVYVLARKNKPSTSRILEGIYYKFQIHNGKAVFLRQSKTYSPQSSGSSGGGHSGGGGGHSGGGGGHSGGGHSF